MGTVLLFQCPYTNKWDARLYLIKVKRNSDGTVKSGWVVNGEWNYERTDTEELAKDGNNIVNRWPILEYKEILVDKDSSDYNKIMKKATEKFNKENVHDS